MLDGKKYRWQYRHTILRTTSATDKEARDDTLAKWRTDKKAGDPHYKDIIDMQAGKEDNIIIANYELTGLFVQKDGQKTEELIPNYNFMLYEYDPHIRFLTDIPSIIEGEKYPDFRKEELKTQKMYYNLFFNFDNMLKNLKLNGLMNEEQIGMSLVHYNFFSSYVHVGKESIIIWLYTNDKFRYNPKVNEDILKELVLLYITKLMHLYLKVIVEHYKKTNSNFQSAKYDSIIKELDTCSKDLWFMDNNPTDFDKKYSEHRKKVRDMMVENAQNTVDILYHENPLKRLEMMRFNQKLFG